MTSSDLAKYSVTRSIARSISATAELLILFLFFRILSEKTVKAIAARPKPEHKMMYHVCLVCFEKGVEFFSFVSVTKF